MPAGFEVFYAGCIRCRNLAIAEARKGAEPEMTEGGGSDCERHRCSVCRLGAPWDGHSVDDDGRPICNTCAENL